MVISTHLPPPVMIDSTAVREAVTHMLCCSWAMCFSAAAFLRERPRQHELGLEHRAGPLDHAVQGCRHPALDRMKHLPLHLGHDLAGIALVPVPVEVLGHGAELDDQVVREVLGLDLAALFPPQAEQGGFIVAHDDAGVRAADEAAPIS